MNINDTNSVVSIISSIFGIITGIITISQYLRQRQSRGQETSQNQPSASPNITRSATQGSPARLSETEKKNKEKVQQLNIALGFGVACFFLSLGYNLYDGVPFGISLARAAAGAVVAAFLMWFCP